MLIEISNTDGKRIAFDPAFVTGVKVTEFQGWRVMVYCDEYRHAGAGTYITEGRPEVAPRYVYGPYEERSEADALFDRIVSAANEARNLLAAP